MTREFVKAILRVTYKREWDPVRNQWKYINRDNGNEMHHEPHTLRKDLWDVNEVSDWSVGHVSTTSLFVVHPPHSTPPHTQSDHKSPVLFCYVMILMNRSLAFFANMV